MRKALKLVKDEEPVVWFNLNHLEYPMFAPVRNPETDSYFIKKKYLTEDGLEKSYELIPGISGLPTAEDFKVLSFLLGKAQEANTQELKIKSMNWLIGELKGNSNGNANYAKYKARILEALERWRMTGINYENTFYVKKGDVCISKRFCNILEFEFYEKRKHSFKGLTRLADFSVRFHASFWEMNHKSLKQTIAMSVQVPNNLKSDLGVRLYGYLYKWRLEMDKGSLKRSFSDLVDLLGLQNVKDIHKPSIVVRKIDAAMKEVGPELKVIHKCFKKERMVAFKLDLDD